MVHSYGRLALVQRELIDLNDIVDKVYQQLRPYAEERGVELALSTQILPLTPAISRHIEQALINTTLNAIQQVKEQSDRWTQLNDQHGPTALHKHVQIRRYVLLCTRFIPETNTCCVGIMDSGPGVPYHLRERIFEINVSTRKDGHGLGLFISRSLIEAMRGRLEWVESQRFWGSAFAIFFHLPKAT
jgi:signal transduction histidine kinase